MRTHRAKSGYLPAEYIWGAFSTRTPSPFCAGWRWGAAIEKNFFWFLFFWFSLVFTECLDWNYFFDFQTSIYTRILFFFIFSDSRLVSPILGFQLNSFTEYLRFSSFIFARYYLDYDSWLRFWFSTRFYSHQVCRFYSSTLNLFISSACYKQTFMLVWVCFMLVLAILRLSDVFSFVLGVVYRLGVK